MPDVNLIKDTEGLSSGRKKPITPAAPELTNPKTTPAAGLGGFFKSIFNRANKPAPAPVAPVVSSMSFKRANSGDDHILQEKRTAAPAVIPLPEDESGYNVNLLSEELITTISIKQRGVVLGLIAVGTAVVVGGLYAALLLYQKSVTSKTSDVESQLTTVRQEATTLAKQQLVASSTVQKLGAINDLIDRHKQWTKFFGLLERYTLKSVTYGTGFTGDIGGSLSLSASTDSYESVAQQYLIFKQLVADQKFISDFSITGATSSANKDGGVRVTFAVTLTLLPEDFTVTKQEAQESQATINPSSSGAAKVQQSLGRLQDIITATCDIIQNPADITLLPDFSRVSILAAADSGAKTLGCETIPAADSSRVASLMKIDQDGDGVDLLFEQVYDTSDITKDSGKGVDDYTYVKQQYLASQSTQ